MSIDSEKDGPKWSTKNDKRITKIGRILRKWRIDELPQLLSVLKGDMSLIGPRPERPEIDKFLISITAGLLQSVLSTETSLRWDNVCSRTSLIE